MLESVSATELVFAVLVVFFACTVFSAMGFGIGIVGLPFLFLMFDPATSIILLNVMALPVVVLVVLWGCEIASTCVRVRLCPS